jgi:hypothetical protein
MELVKERISDRTVLKLIRHSLGAGVMEDGTLTETLAGTPAGRSDDGLNAKSNFQFERVAPYRKRQENGRG